MATILPFVPPTGSGRIRRGAADGGGQVVIFPGVRYERHDFDGPGGADGNGAEAGRETARRRRRAK